MTARQKALLGVVLVVNAIGCVLGLIGIQPIRAWRFGPFQVHDGMFMIFLPFHPIPPDWLFIPWAYAPVGLVVACLLLPIGLPVLLLLRGRKVLAWASCLILTALLGGSGVWIWLHAHFNVLIAE